MAQSNVIEITNITKDIKHHRVLDNVGTTLQPHITYPVTQGVLIESFALCAVGVALALVTRASFTDYSSNQTALDDAIYRSTVYKVYKGSLKEGKEFSLYEPLSFSSSDVIDHQKKVIPTNWYYAGLTPMKTGKTYVCALTPNYDKYGNFQGYTFKMSTDGDVYNMFARIPVTDDIKTYVRTDSQLTFAEAQNYDCICDTAAAEKDFCETVVEALTYVKAIQV